MYELQSTRDVISKSENLDDVLQHFGTKGMKWGVRKSTSGSSDKDARREEKVKRLDAKAEGYRSKISNIQSQSVDGKRATKKQNSQIKKLAKKELQAIKDSKAKSEGKLTRREKQVLIGGAIVATYAAYSLGQAAQSGELNRLAMKGEAYLRKNSAPSFKKNSMFAKQFTDPDELFNSVVPGINDHGAVGGKVNCRRATFAYEMRRRGNDVAATRTTSGLGQKSDGVFNAIHPNEKIVGNSTLSGLRRDVKETYTKARAEQKGIKVDTPYMDFRNSLKANFTGMEEIDAKGPGMSNRVFEGLAKQPNNARGELAFNWSNGGAHSVAWEIVNNKPVIFDTQTGKMFKDPDMFKRYGDNISAAAFTRLDDKPLNEDFLMRWVKNAK